MKNKILFCQLLVFIIANCTLTNRSFARNTNFISQARQNKITESSQGNEINFSPNKGQIADRKGNPCPDVLYKGNGVGVDVYLRKTGVSYVFNNMGQIVNKVGEQVSELVKSGTITEADEHKINDELLQKENVKIHRIDMDFDGANKNIRTLNEGELNGFNNYYYAHCPNGITNVKQYNKITYKNIYNGIEVKYYGDKQNGIKYDLIVQPHADPTQIKLHWTGAESMHLNREGNLIIKTSVNEFTESIPKVYQIINGRIIDVKAQYKLTSLSASGGRAGEGFIVSFSFGEGWNEIFPLIIDPWVTYYGGNKWDQGKSIATDLQGNVVITGATGSGTFPTGQNGGYVVQQAAFGGSSFDAFVVKFAPTGAMLWATYYGGDQSDSGTGIATDLNTNVLITGNTFGGTFPTGQNGGNVVQQGTYGGGVDAFVVKFASTGAMLWATYYGGQQADLGNGIATDMNGNVIITGRTTSTTFPTGQNGGNVVQQGTYGGVTDAFVVKFAPTGAMLWATYYGGNQSDYGDGIATDLNTNVVITGYTAGGTFPTGQNGGNVVQQGTYGGGVADAFVVKFSPTGAMLWATFYGGIQYDYGTGIATDMNNGNVVIAGQTRGGFPIGQNGGNVVMQGALGGPDAFVVKFSPTGAMLWATYLGGSDIDYGLSVQVDAVTNDVFVSGDTYSLNFPVSSCAWQKNLAGGISEDGFVTHFKPDGSLLCSSYVGGAAAPNDEDCHIALFGCYVYMTGYTGGSYPVTSGAWQTTYGGGSDDTFVAQLYKNSCGFDKTAALTAVAIPNTVCNNTPINFTGNFSVSCDNSAVSYTWSFPGGTPVTSNNQNPTGIVYPTAGNYTAQLKAKTVCDSSSKDVNITILPCTVCNLSGQFTKGTANCSECGCKEWIVITATGGTSPYSYLWPDGYDKRYKNQLCPGSYTINIKDKNGCDVNINLTTP